ncbi:pantetheine-phosphate adenylyltransferase [Sporolactobacillus sp. KGMB 08714]|uniref:pantetheine-phosphate adenylyltransferase n=1 Tax=Sporolactobacillus sp. KGMB 08714 TaxID=3064704 RepID=UPI002FBE1A66
MKRIAVYPGSFDPVTLGHLDIIKRGSCVFDEIIVAVLNNSSRHPLFSVSERKAMLTAATCHLDHVRIDSFNGPFVDYMIDNGLSVILRGLREIADFEYEMKSAWVNKYLDHHIETCFMISVNPSASLSSGAVKKIAQHGGDASGLVPEVADRFLKKILCTEKEKMLLKKGGD